MHTQNPIGRRYSSYIFSPTMHWGEIISEGAILFLFTWTYTDEIRKYNFITITCWKKNLVKTELVYENQKRIL